MKFNFFLPLSKSWTLRVSGMDGYTSKCEKKSKSLHPNVQVAVYAPSERADTLPLFHLYPYVLCGQEAATLTHCVSENVIRSKSRAQQHKFIAYLKAILFIDFLWLFCYYECA
jgi:hypothetical protein